MARDWTAWLSMADEFLREAEALVESAGAVGMAFLAHQAAESALKAVWIRLGDGIPPHTHSLTEMSKGLDAPSSVAEACRSLNPLYMTSRYPDAANGNPMEQFTVLEANRAVEQATLVVQWCHRMLREAEGDEGNGA